MKDNADFFASFFMKIPCCIRVEIKYEKFVAFIMTREKNLRGMKSITQKKIIRKQLFTYMRAHIHYVFIV